MVRTTTQPSKYKFTACTKRSQEVLFHPLRLLTSLCYHCSPHKQTKHQPLSTPNPKNETNKKNIHPKTTTKSQQKILQMQHSTAHKTATKIYANEKTKPVICHPRKLGTSSSTTLASIHQKASSFDLCRMDKLVSGPR